VTKRLSLATGRWRLQPLDPEQLWHDLTVCAGFNSGIVSARRIIRSKGELKMVFVTTPDVLRASRRVCRHASIDRRVRWFAYLRRQWVPITAVYREAAGLNHCHTYRAQGALELLGIPVRRFKSAKSLRLQRDLLLTT
jgi:hypothetical protein